MDAAREAVACSVFKSAAKYVKSGTALVPDDAFTENYDLTLELFSLGAEVEGCIDNDAEIEAYCHEHEVIYHAVKPLDKIQCSNVQLSRLEATRRGRRWQSDYVWTS